VRAAFAIARREVRERLFLFAAATTSSLGAIALQHAPGLPGLRAVGEYVGMAVAIAFPIATALAVGASVVARDVAERRLSFYFARPLSAASLWAGKFLGGAELILIVAVVCFLPVQLSLALDPAYVALGVLALLGVMPIASVVAAMYRSRSRLFALDLGAGVLVLALLALQARRLLVAGATGALVAALAVGLAAIMVAALAASAIQLAYGRADVHRGHIGLSATLWTIVAAGVGAFALWSGWVLSVKPSDLGGVGYAVLAAPRGGLVVLRSWRGRAGYSPFFMMDVDRNAYTRLRSPGFAFPAFDAEGNTAVWVERPTLWLGLREPRLAVARRGDGVPTVEGRPLDASEPWTTALAVDTVRRRVIVASRASVGVVDLDAGTLLSRTPTSDVNAAELRPDGIIRLYEQEGRGTLHTAFVVRDWNPKDDALVERVRISSSSYPALLARRGDLAVVWLGQQREAVLDTSAGTTWTLEAPKGVSPAALVLSTGQVALALRSEVRLVSAAGQTLAAVPVDSHERAFSLAEPSPGELAIGLATSAFEPHRTLFVDAATGVVRREEKDVLPAGIRFGLAGTAPEPGSLGSRLFTDSNGALIALEPDGRRRVIVSARD
jgi:hypothetical protein